MTQEKQYDCPEWLKNMPKTDIHCHMGGSMRIDTLIDLADQNGIKLPAQDKKELEKHVVYKDRPGKKTLKDYLDCIKIFESVLVTPDAFNRVAYEICEDANSENVKVLELRFGPTNYEKKDLNLFEIMEATLDGLKRAAKDYHMQTGLIVCGIRTDLDATRKAVELAINYQDSGVIGFDLAGKENGFRPKIFEEIIKPVLFNFVPVTVHAGEDDTVASIAEAIIYLNARRIGHGVSLRESPRIMEYLDTTRTCIEVCVTSNVDTGAVKTIATHPARTYFHDDLRMAIATDNRTVSDTTITKEYLKLMNELGFQRDEIFKLGRDSIKSAFLNSQIRRSLLKQFDSYVMQYQRDNMETRS